MGRGMHSNNKQCGWGTVGISWARFQFADFISGLKKWEGVSHHFN